MDHKKNIRRSRAIAFTRSSFRLLWTINAYFKWQTTFANNFLSYFKEPYDSQPALIQSWLNPWINPVNGAPHLLARLIALRETGIAICLILGLFSNLDYGTGIILTLLIWAIPEGFSGPYTAGATDLGAGILNLYAVLGLLLFSARQYYGLDRYLWPKSDRLGFLASRPLDQD